MKEEHHEVTIDVQGPWSLTTSRSFWEGFTPAALDHENQQPSTEDPSDSEPVLKTVFCVEADWRTAHADVTEHQGRARILVRGDGDLDAAAEQVARFLSLDIDARAWPDIADRDPVIAHAQMQLPGLRPCGFHSPYEAAAWSVLSQRIRMTQASKLRRDLIARYGKQGAFPAPEVMRSLTLNLPGRKTEYLHAVAEAALEGVLDAVSLRAMSVEAAKHAVMRVKGLGPFAAELVVIRGANAPDALPQHEQQLTDEVAEWYGPGANMTEISESWRPFRSWAAVHLRALRERSR